MPCRSSMGCIKLGVFDQLRPRIIRPGETDSKSRFDQDAEHREGHHDDGNQVEQRLNA